jgi:penicillin G amidase
MSEIEEQLREAATEALPPVEGEIRLPGLRAPVEVIRDRWGVPHLYAQHLPDLWRAQGYVVASERLFQAELLFRLSLGRLSELFGELTLPLDRFVRTVGWNRIAARQARQRDDLSGEMVAAYAAGVRAWRGSMPAPPVEYRVLQADPWVPEAEEAQEAGRAAAVLLAWSLSRAWDNDLLRAELLERHGLEVMRTLFPDVSPEPEAVRANKVAQDPRLALLREAFLPPSGQGSNAWVVDGSRSGTGRPLLANDPHLLAQAPSIWFEIHLVAPGIDVAGVTFPFTPGVIIGHNDRIAWGFTNTDADVQDLYLERLSEDGRRVEYRGHWEPVAVHQEAIRVRGRTLPDVVTARETRHGPLLDSYLVGVADPEVIEGGVRHPYALRWVGAERTVEPSTILRLNTARDWEGFRAAVEHWHCPGQNAIYADADGNIGYQMTGLHPIRRAGDGSLPVPGWTDAYEWDGWVPFDELPRALNPEAGFLVSANNRMYDEGYPHELGVDFLPSYRARRITELLTARDRHDRGSFARIQTDTVSIPAREIVPRLLEVEPVDDRQREALAHLAGWDHDLDTGSTAAAIYEVWAVRIAERVLLPLLGDEVYDHYYARRQWTNGFHYRVLPDLLAYPSARWFGGEGTAARDRLLREALDAALDELAERLGEDMSAWRWGALHTVRFAGRLARIPGLEGFFTAGEVEMGGDEQTVCQGLFEPGVGYRPVVVPSWRQILEPGDWDASLGIHPVGQSGNPASPHARDLLELWARGEHHPMPFSRPAVEAHAEATLRLLPG